MLRTSCGVVVTDGVRLLLGHATRSPRWDIPKGVAEAGETHLAAALPRIGGGNRACAPTGGARAARRACLHAAEGARAVRVAAGADAGPGRAHMPLGHPAAGRRSDPRVRQVRPVRLAGRTRSRRPQHGARARVARWRLSRGSSTPSRMCPSRDPADRGCVAAPAASAPDASDRSAATARAARPCGRRSGR